MKKLQSLLVLTTLMLSSHLYATVIDFESNLGASTTTTNNSPTIFGDYTLTMTHGHNWGASAGHNGNGTDWIINDSVGLSSFTRTDLGTFDLTSIDLAVWSNSYSSGSTTFTGFLNGVQTDQMIVNYDSDWTTYYFGFMNIDSLQFFSTNVFSLGLDNVVVNESASASVPEPSIIALMGLGILGIGLSRRKLRNKPAMS